MSPEAFMGLLRGLVLRHAQGYGATTVDVRSEPMTASSTVIIGCTDMPPVGVQGACRNGIEDGVMRATYGRMASTMTWGLVFVVGRQPADVQRLQRWHAVQEQARDGN